MWQRIKAEEKAARGAAAPSSRLDDVPIALPALTRAVKLQKRAAEVGFDWPSLAPRARQGRGRNRRAESGDRRERRRKRAQASALSRSSAICCSSWRISRAISASIRKRRCAAPTANSCGVSQHRGGARQGRPQARRRDAGRDGSALGRGQGGREGQLSLFRREPAAARGRRGGRAARVSRERTRMRKAVTPSPTGLRSTTSQFS